MGRRQRPNFPPLISLFTIPFPFAIYPPRIRTNSVHGGTAMKHLGWAACFVCLTILAIRCAALLGQGPDLGPGAGGAALRNPYDAAPARPSVPLPPRPGATEVERTVLGKSGPAPAPSLFPDLRSEEGAPGRPKGLAGLKPSEKEDINRDIAVTPALGPWLISVMSYVGPQAPVMAREFAFELRNTHKMQAYVFNYAAEENRKEYERVKEFVDRQKKALEATGLPMEQKLRIRYTFVPDQCAVLIAGYASAEAAARDAERIRKLAPPDPRKVKLDTKLYAEYELVDGKSPLRPDLKAYKPPTEAKEAKIVSVNPFKRAFHVPNPSIKVERAAEPEAAFAYDLPSLRKLNKGEPYSLLECKKSLTLAITHFRTPTAIEGTEPTAGSGGFLAGLGFGKKKEREDYAATNANVLAENLRKHFKLDAFVLHTRYDSVVTVGGYDSADDPNLRSMKNLLQTRLRIPTVEMFPEPYLMKVPR